MTLHGNLKHAVNASQFSPHRYCACLCRKMTLADNVALMLFKGGEISFTHNSIFMHCLKIRILQGCLKYHLFLLLTFQSANYSDDHSNSL